MVAYLLYKHQADPAEQATQLTLLARQWLEAGRVPEAWRVLLLATGSPAAA